MNLSPDVMIKLNTSQLHEINRQNSITNTFIVVKGDFYDHNLQINMF